MSTTRPSRAHNTRYDAGDVLEAFLFCIVDAQALAPNDPRIAMARRALAWIESCPLSTSLCGPSDEADIEGCLCAFSPDAPKLFRDDTSLDLWNTLKEALSQIEPMATGRGSKTVPRTLDQIWSLLEAAEIYASQCEDAGQSDGSTGTGSGSRRL